MSVLEMEAPACVRPKGDEVSGMVVAISPAMLGLSLRPTFVAAEVVSPDRPTLWDSMRLSWAEPRTARDLVAADARRVPAVSARLRGTG
jgi:hypothetical protein